MLFKTSQISCPPSPPTNQALSWIFSPLIKMTKNNIKKYEVVILKFEMNILDLEIDNL